MNSPIVPAILSQDFGDIKYKLGTVKGYCSTVQIDIVDGVLGPQKTWPYTDEESFSKILKEEETLPFWENFSFEFDCMVSNPKNQLENFVMAGAERVVVHLEAFKDKEECLNTIVQFKEKYSTGGALDVKIGLAIKADTVLSDITSIIDEADFVQIMGIKNIGKQGEPFEENTFSKIKEIKSLNSQKIVSVDGGVNFENVEELFLSGLDFAVVGSAIWGDDNPRIALRELKEIAEGVIANRGNSII